VNGEERLHVIEGDVDGDGQQNIVSGQNVPGAVQLIAVDDHQNTEQQIQDGQQTAFPLVAFFHDRLQEGLLFLRLEVRDAGERRQPVFAVAVFQPDCGNGADDQAGLEIRHEIDRQQDADQNQQIAVVIQREVAFVLLRDDVAAAGRFHIQDIASFVVLIYIMPGYGIALGGLIPRFLLCHVRCLRIVLMITERRTEGKT